MSHSKEKSKEKLKESTPIVPDVLSEEKLFDLLASWENKLDQAENEEEAKKCQEKIRFYNLRLYRLGAI